MWEKLMHRYHDMMLEGKIMTVFITFLLIFCIVSQMILQLCLAIYDEKLYERSLLELDYFTQEVNRSLEAIKDLSAEIAMDDNIQEKLTKLSASQKADATYLLGILDLRSLITSYMNLNWNIKSAAYYDGKMTDIMLGIHVTDIPDTIKEEFTDPLLKARGGCVIRDPDQEWPYFLAGRNILEKKNARLAYLGTILLCYDVEGMIRKNIESLQAEHASLYVYTDDWMIYQDEEIEGLRLPRYKEGKGYEIVQVGRQRYFMCYLYSRSTGWMYANVFPYTEIYGQTQRIRMMLMVSVVLMAVVFAAGMKGFIRTITRPLNELTRTMKIVETGDFEGAREYLTLEDRKDETGQLQKEFDTMLGKINELIKENYEKQLLLKDTSYRMLRAQINPHFIYNTLNTINWMVKWKKNEEVSRLIMEFGKLLRSSFEGNPFATVEEEVELAEGYMAIQAYRYKSRADFIVEKSGELEKYRTPRMILQPLIENAIYYGIENSLEKCMVCVSVWETEEFIWYKVTDNGSGMSEENLIAARNGTICSKGNGIGLSNIRERLRLWSDKSEFMIDSIPGTGTSVQIRIPKKEVRLDVQAPDCR